VLVLKLVEFILPLFYAYKIYCKTNTKQLISVWNRRQK